MHGKRKRFPRRYQNHEFLSTTHHSMSKSREKSLIQRAQKSHGYFWKSKAGRNGAYDHIYGIKQFSFKNRKKSWQIVMTTQILVAT